MSPSRATRPIATRPSRSPKGPIGKPFPHPRCVSALAFSPDGKSFASGCEDGRARLWDVATGTLLVPSLGHQAWVFGVAFHPDGGTLATGHGRGLVVLWDAEMLRGEDVESGHAHDVRTLAFSPDGRTLVTGGADSTIRDRELIR